MQTQCSYMINQIAFLIRIVYYNPNRIIELYMVNITQIRVTCISLIAYMK